MRYTTLSVLSALLITTSLPVLAAGGMNKHDASIANYNYNLPIIVNTTTLSTGSLRDELDNGTRLQADKAPAVVPMAPAMTKPAPMVAKPPQPMPTMPKTPVVAPKATDMLPDTLPNTLPKTTTTTTTTTTVATPPMPPVTPPAPPVTPPADGMMGGQAVPNRTN